MRMAKMAKKVAAKNAAKPSAKLISRVVNQPRSPSGTPNRYPAPTVSETVRGEVEPSLCVVCAIPVEYCFMADGVENGLVGLGGLVPAGQVIREATVRQTPNGVHYAGFGG